MTRRDHDQLSIDLREHDLPPRWDGHPVQWGEWKPMPDVTICPPPKADKCVKCGSTEAANQARGVRQDFANVRRLLGGDLIAMRCPRCDHDVVWDLATNEWWDLDDSDYQDGGSREVSGR